MSSMETHEPDEPIDWPYGHVWVTGEPEGSDPADRVRLNEIDVEIVYSRNDEEVVLVLGEWRHYLYMSTAREFELILAGHQGARAVVIHEVAQSLNGMAVRGLQQLMRKKLGALGYELL